MTVQTRPEGLLCPAADHRAECVVGPANMPRRMANRQTGAGQDRTMQSLPVCD